MHVMKGAQNALDCCTIHLDDPKRVIALSCSLDASAKQDHGDFRGAFIQPRYDFGAQVLARTIEQVLKVPAARFLSFQ